jgi:hypothetical protein
MCAPIVAIAILNITNKVSHRLVMVIVVICIAPVAIVIFVDVGCHS